MPPGSHSRQERVYRLKDLIKDSIREIALSQDQSVLPVEERPVETPLLRPSSEANSEDELVAVEDNSTSFDLALVDPFVVAVKDAIQWEEDPEPPSKTKKYFPHLTKKVSTSP